MINLNLSRCFSDAWLELYDISGFTHQDTVIYFVTREITNPICYSEHGRFLEISCNHQSNKNICSMIQWNLTAVAVYQIPCSMSSAFLRPLRSGQHARHYAAAGQSGLTRPIRNRPQKSLQVSIKEQMSKEMPKDLGILPGKSSLDRNRFVIWGT